MCNIHGTSTSKFSMTQEFVEDWVAKQPSANAAFNKAMIKSKVMDAIDTVSMMHKSNCDTLKVRAKPRGVLTGKQTFDKGQLYLAPSTTSIATADANVESKGPVVHKCKGEAYVATSSQYAPYWYVKGVDDEGDANMREDVVAVKVAFIAGGEAQQELAIKVPVYRNKVKLGSNTELTISKPRASSDAVPKSKAVAAPAARGAKRTKR